MMIKKIAMLCAGILLLLIVLVFSMPHRTLVQANTSNSVLGPPTLSLAQVEHIFSQSASPMRGTGAVILQAAQETNIDNAFALAVWWAETNHGAAGVGSADLNPGAVRGSMGYAVAYDGYTIYPSYTAAIKEWFKLLKQRYINEGLTDVYTICNPYVGTTGALAWADKVSQLMHQYRGEAHLFPTPTRTPKARLLNLEASRNLPKLTTPKPTATIAVKQKAPVPTRQSQPVHIDSSVAMSSDNARLLSYWAPQIFPALLIIVALTLLLRFALSRRPRTTSEDTTPLKTFSKQQLTQLITEEHEYVDTVEITRIEQETDKLPIVPPTPAIVQHVDVPLTPFIAHEAQSVIEQPALPTPQPIRSARRQRLVPFTQPVPSVDRQGRRRIIATEVLPKIKPELLLPTREPSSLLQDTRGLVKQFVEHKKIPTKPIDKSTGTV